MLASNDRLLQAHKSPTMSSVVDSLSEWWSLGGFLAGWVGTKGLQEVEFSRT